MQRIAHEFHKFLKQVLNIFPVLAGMHILCKHTAIYTLFLMTKGNVVPKTLHKQRLKIANLIGPLSSVRHPTLSTYNTEIWSAISDLQAAALANAPSI